MVGQDYVSATSRDEERVALLKTASTKGRLFFRLRREDLSRLRLRAMRRGVWFKALSRMDRVLIGVTIKVADVVRSSKLAGLLLPIVEKLRLGLESKVSFAMVKVGFPLARKIGLLAQRWGNRMAEYWMFDVSFARFLAAMHVNDRRAFRV